MDDRELDNLIRMALEVEALEGDGAARAVATERIVPAPVPALRLVGGGRAGVGVRWRIWAMTAAGLAATLALAFFGPWSRGGEDRGVTVPAPPVAIDLPNDPLPSDPESGSTLVHQTVPKPLDQGWAVLAIFSGPDGQCRCMHLDLHDPAGVAGRELADVGSAELLGMAFEAPCTADLERLLIVAIAGPEADLPRTTEDAEVLAACMEDVPEGAQHDPSAYASAAVSCLPAGMTVVAETLAITRP